MIQRVLEPNEVWDFWLKQPHDVIGVMHQIASNDQYGVSIYITADNSKDLRIVVECDDIQVYEEELINNVDCEKTCEKVYSDYLTESVSEVLMEAFGEEAIDEEQDSIDEREEELDSAIYNFFTDVLGEEAYMKVDDPDAVLEDLKEHFLEYMARKHGLTSIYRPMRLEDVETNEEYYTEYPYEDMVYDDEDNPVYKNDAE